MIRRLQRAVDGDLRGPVGIGHTRWSTHGPPSDANGHPHTDCTGGVPVVHNGIIKNYGDLRAELADRATSSTATPTPRSSRT